MQWIINDVPLGRNIQAIRIRKNMTQKFVVTKLNLLGSSMSRSTLANIEAGRRNIKASDLKLLKIIFDVEYDEFFWLIRHNDKDVKGTMMNIAVCDDEKIVTTQIESIIYSICKKEHIDVDIDVFYYGTELAIMVS